MKRWLFVIITMMSSLSQAESVKVTIKPHNPEAWSKETLAFVQKAAEITFNRIRTHRVAQCAYRHTFRGRYNKDKLRKIWGKQIPILNKNPKVTLRVYQAHLPESALGRAAVSTANVNRSDYRIENLDISLNKEKLNRYVSQYSKRSGTEDAINKWVNVIAHEIGHNLGHSHDNGGDWAGDYPGYFVTELGFCTMTNGKYGSELGDAALRRRFKSKK